MRIIGETEPDRVPITNPTPTPTPAPAPVEKRSNTMIYAGVALGLVVLLLVLFV